MLALPRAARRLAVAASLAAASLAAAGPATAADAVAIAVFPFELEDFSAAGRQSPSPDQAAALADATEEARQHLLRSGRYRIVDTGAVASTDLRDCGGCEAALARSLGADEALVGVVTKISMTEYVVTLRVTDALTGAAVARFTTDLRMGASYAWSRGVRWLMRNRVLAAK